MQKVKLVVLKNIDFENRDLFLLLAISEFSACQDSDAKKNMDNFFETSPPGKKRLLACT